MQNILLRPKEIGTLQTQRWKAIPQGEYRNYCYEQPGVIDRMSICQNIGGLQSVMNLYRFRETGYFAANDIKSLRHIHAPVSALIGKHVLLLHQPTRSDLHPPLELLGENIRNLNSQLSHRESQVCAAMLIGMQAKEISRTIGVEVNTVVTYKKRAFEKLGIATRR